MEYVSTLVGNPLSFEWKRHSYSDTEAWGGMAEPFRIDDLLDFSNDDIAGPIGYDEENTSESCLTESCESQEANYSSQFQLAGEPLPGELCVPTDALAELEWLSNFVEEPLITAEDVAELDHSRCNAMPSVEDGTKENRGPPSGERGALCRFEMLIPGRARSKRSRTGGRVWSFHSDPGFEPRGPVFEPRGPVFAHLSDASSRPAKRANHGKKPHDGSLPQPRRCSHCLSQKTPQWRAGPLGPKTLCNACGVRFKSGRLLPEYRPFGSPTFSSDIHSNSHRKVLEIRRQKEQPSVLCKENPAAQGDPDMQVQA